jgi:ribosome biogenesis protein UTP30
MEKKTNGRKLVSPRRRRKETKNARFFCKSRNACIFFPDNHDLFIIHHHHHRLYHTIEKPPHNTNMPIPVDRDQVARAVDALKKHTAKAAAASKDLLAADHVPLHMQLTLRTVPARAHPNPIRIPVPHALRTPGSVQTLLITKDPHDDVKKAVKSLGLDKYVQKVISVGKLKTKFSQYEERRALLGAFDLFLADERVLTALPRVLGSKFYEKKKTPVAIRTDAKHIQSDIEACFASTFLSYGRGTCVSVEFANVQMGTQDAVDNLVAALEGVRAKIGHQVVGVSIKTNSSVALPVWNAAVETKSEGEKVEKVEEKKKGKVAVVQEEKKKQEVVEEKKEKKSRPLMAKKPKTVAA